MDFFLYVLGSGSALPTVKRNPTSQLIKHYNDYILIDCGEGAQLQMRTMHLPLQSIQHILISHLHGDHFLGLFGLLSSMHLLGRTKPLNIYSDDRLQEIINLHLKVSNTRLNYELRIHPLNYDTKHEIFSTRNLKVYSFPLKHRIPTCGFLITEKPKEPRIDKLKIKEHELPLEAYPILKSGMDYKDSKGIIYKPEHYTIPAREPLSYAYCSDTIFDRSLKEYISGATVLYHESTFMEEHKIRAAETFHSTATEAAIVAKDSLVKLLLLGHYSARYTHQDVFVQEAKKHFENVLATSDRMTLNINTLEVVS